MAVYMPFNKFISAFFARPGKEHLKQERKSRLSHNDVQYLAASESERDLATRFAKLVNDDPNNAPSLCPGFNVAFAQGRWDPNTEGPPKVDGALYPADDTPRDGLPHWDKQRLLIEFTLGGTAADPFDDLDWSAAAKKRADRYVAHALALQQRTALYTLLINGPEMRLARWDRSGVVYSEAVDYVQDPVALRNALWAFSRASPEAQGVDATATPLGRESAEYQLMDEFARAQETDVREEEGTLVQIDKASKKTPRVFAYVRRMFAESIQGGNPRYKLTVPKKNGKSAREFLVGGPSYVTPGFVGRATRGYVALDLEGGRFVYLKDTWLPQSEDPAGQILEGDVLKKLSQGEVKNVPTLVCHGELAQDTQTPSYWGARPGFARAGTSYTEGMTGRPASVSTRNSNGTSQSNGRPPTLRMFRHYRIVVEEVCLPLNRFQTGRQLLSVVKDCVDAHAMAYESRSRILHRDIGDGNILIRPTLVKVRSGEYTVEWKGVLADWELAKCMPYIGGEIPNPHNRPPARSGSWHSFAAAHALDRPYTPAHVEDELESFLHVLHYNGLRYLRHECNDVPQTIAAYFGEDALDASKPDEHAQFPYPLPRCQLLKREAMRKGVLRAARPPVYYEAESLAGSVPREREPHGASEFYVVDADGRADKHPFNRVIWTMLRWTAARYEAVEAHTPSPLREKHARKLETHAPLRTLLDRALAMEWPDDDRVGDQLEVAGLMAAEGEEGMEVDTEAEKPMEVEAGVADPWLIQEEERAQPVSMETRKEERTKPTCAEPPSKKAKKDGSAEGKASAFPSFMRGLGLSRRGARKA